jgi:hypothetical protein
MTKTYEEEVCAAGACSKHRSCSAGSAMTAAERNKCDAEVALYNEYDRLKSEKVGMDVKIKTAKEEWYKAAFNNLSRYDADAKREGGTKAKEIIKEWKIDFDQIYNSIQNTSNLFKSFEAYCPTAENLDINYLKLIKNDNINSKKLIKQSNIDERMATYYNNSDYYNDMLYYIKWVYWVLFIFCFVMLIMSGQWRNIKTYVFFVVLAAFPTLILQKGITWANTNISQVKINTLYLIFLIMGGLIVSMLYYSGNLAMPTEKITQPIQP